MSTISNFAESEHQSLPASTIVQDQDFRKSSILSQMKYVRPYTLVKELQKKTKELAQRKSLGGACLLALNMDGWSDCVSIAQLVLAKNGIQSVNDGIVFTNKRTIGAIASQFQYYNFHFNAVGYVIGLPLTKEKDNPELVQVKNLVADLYRTRKLEGLKYTYMYKRWWSVKKEYFDLCLKDQPPLDEDNYFPLDEDED